MVVATVGEGGGWSAPTRQFVVDCRKDVFLNSLQHCSIPSRELTYPPKMAYLKMIFLFPRWDMLIPWRVFL